MDDDTFRAGAFSVVLSLRGDHVLAVEQGEADGASDMRAYLDVLERFVRRAGVTKVLFDARADGAPRKGDEGVREARWEYLSARTTVTRSGVVADNEIAQTRINMTARARGVTLRAFLDYPSAEKWLADG